MADVNVYALQNAANRFAKVAGFSPLVTDGIMGSKTFIATVKALDWVKIAQDDVQWQDALSTQAGNLQALATTDSTVLTRNALAVSGFLNSAANSYSLVILPPTSIPGGGGSATNHAATIATTALNPFAPASGASVLDAFKRLPTWQKVALGAIAGLGILWLGRAMKHRGVLSGFSSPWLRDEKSGQLVRPASAHEVDWYKSKGRVDLPNPAQRGGGMRRYSVVEA